VQQRTLSAELISQPLVRVRVIQKQDWSTMHK
jgi:hypothetical protein